MGGVGSSYSGVQSVPEVTLVLGSTSMALVKGLAPVALGQGSMKKLEEDLRKTEERKQRNHGGQDQRDTATIQGMPGTTRNGREE